jgi:hypothetical protein
MSELGHSRWFDRAPITSGLPRLADILSGIPLLMLPRWIRKATTGLRIGLCGALQR